MKKKNQLLEGRIKRHPDGFGFLIPTDPTEPDVYIPKHSMNGAMTQDLVVAQIYPEGRDRFRGDIQKIISRGLTEVVGLLHLVNSRLALVKDDERGWGEDLKVELSTPIDTNKLARIEIQSYPGDKAGFRGKLTEVLGSAADPNTDNKRVLISHAIPFEFSPRAQKEAQALKPEVDLKKITGRKDLRSTSLITIDGATAKDFDDAIFVEAHKKGYKLIVAIADVSHYVKPGSAIDQDAYTRGTSVYFPHFVTPMLPEILSNELCSLKPHVPRLALVAEMQFDLQGEKISSQFYEAIIQSHARMTYGEAQEIIDGGEVPERFKKVASMVLKAKELAQILMTRRFKQGSLELEIPETQVVLDDAGQPIDIIKTQRLFAHRLIEEMMLAANIAVAEVFAEHEIPSLYRIHEPPQEGALQTLEKFAWNFGHKTNLNQTAKSGAPGSLQKKLTKLLQELHGKPEGTALNILTLRSMSQAKYSPHNVGHFGLGFANYSHFTSPIRRYPDLIVHRLIKAILKVKSYSLMSEEDLLTAGVMLSACEQRAVKAERNLIAIKKARFMEKHLGQEFDGFISSVTKFGAFVSLREFEVDGLVKLESLSKEKLLFDEEHMRLRGSRSGLSFKIGDPLRVKVSAVNIQAGQIDFEKVIEKKIITPDAVKVIDSKSAERVFDGGKHLEALFSKKGLVGNIDGPSKDSSSNDRRKNKSDRRKQSRDRRNSDRSEENPETSRQTKNGSPFSARSRPELKSLYQKKTLSSADGRRDSLKKDSSEDSRPQKLHFGKPLKKKSDFKSAKKGFRR